MRLRRILLPSIALALVLATQSILAPVAAAITVVAAGDIACGTTGPACPAPPAGDQDEATADLIAAINPTAVFVIGDAQYPHGEYQQFVNNYDTTWGRFFRKTHPVPGNHEYGGGQNARGYFRYFGRRAHGPGGYYSFNIGKWHIIALNSKRGDRPERQQVQWLARDLRADRHRCELAFFHYPRWSSGAEDGPNPTMQGFWKLLTRYRVDVALGAHDHNYERFAPMGTTGPRGGVKARGTQQFVVGTGGRNLNGFMSNPLSTSIVRLVEFGVLRLRLAARSYSWAFKQIDDTTGDSGSRRCHA